MKPNSVALSNAAYAGSDNAQAAANDAETPRSAAVVLLLALLRAYKLCFSPLFLGSCRFVPSCSDYAASAIAEHGASRGTWLAVKRLARCHPFCAGGHDPVPPRG